MRTQKQASKGTQILASLKRAYPGGCTSSELMEITSRAQARLGELRQAGWEIVTHQEGDDAQATYRLSSLIRGPEEQVIAGVVIRLGSKGGWTSRTHQEARGGSVPESVLMEAQAAAVSAYRQVVDQWCPVKVDPVDPVMAFFLEDM